MNMPETTLESRIPEHPILSREDWSPAAEEPLREAKAPMLKRFGWALLGVLIVLPVAAGIVTVKVLQFRVMGTALARQVLPPQPVNVADVVNELVNIILTNCAGRFWAAQLVA